MPKDPLQRRIYIFSRKKKFREKFSRPPIFLDTKARKTFLANCFHYRRGLFLSPFNYLQKQCYLALFAKKSSALAGFQIYFARTQFLSKITWVNDVIREDLTSAKNTEFQLLFLCFLCVNCSTTQFNRNPTISPSLLCKSVHPSILQQFLSKPSLSLLKHPLQ